MPEDEVIIVETTNQNVYIQTPGPQGAIGPQGEPGASGESDLDIILAMVIALGG